MASINNFNILVTVTFILIYFNVCVSSNDSYYFNKQSISEQISPDDESSQNVNYDILSSEEFTEIFSGYGIFLNAALAYSSPGNLKSGEKEHVNVSHICQHDIQQIINDLYDQKEWSLRLMDAQGKIPAGVLDGNLHWLGAYDECREITVPRYSNSAASVDNSGFLNGQYCTTSVKMANPNVANSKLMKALVKRLQIGFCLPDSCSAEEARIIINTVFRKLPADISINVNEIRCNPKYIKFDGKAIFAIIFFVLYASVVLTGTLYDLYGKWKSNKLSNEENITNMNGTITSEPNVYQLKSENNHHHDNSQKKKIRKPQGKLQQVLLCFSLYSNWQKLFSLDSGEGCLTSINGIRFLSISWVAMAHTYLYMRPFQSNIRVADWKTFTGYATQIFGNSSLCVDTFFTMSGLLLSYLMLKDLKKNRGKMKWGMFYFHRYWRLTTPYMLILMFYATLFKYLGDGPLWIPENLEPNDCIDSWFYNLLYINNFVDAKHRCLNSAWYLANDMQFYVISPLFLIPLFRFKVMGVVMVLVGLAASLTTTGVIARMYELAPAGFLHYGHKEPSVSSFEAYYIKPYCRIGPYLVGILTGYILYKMELKCKLNKYLNLLCWGIAFVLGVCVVYGLRNDFAGDHLPPNISALYIATHRTVWGASVSWVIFSCVTGNGGFVNTLLSWKVFLPLSRLTYIIYLINPMVIDFFLYQRRDLFIITTMTHEYVFMAAFIVSIMVAIILSLTLESPLMGLERILLRKGSKKT